MASREVSGVSDKPQDSITTAVNTQDDRLVDEMKALKEYLATRFTQQDMLLAQLLERSLSGQGDNEAPLTARFTTSNGAPSNEAPPQEDVHRTKSRQSLRQETHRDAASFKNEEALLEQMRSKDSKGSQGSQEAPGIRPKLAEIASSKHFDHGILMLVALNVIVMTVELQLDATTRKSQKPAAIEVVNIIFNFLFLFEVIFKWVALGVKHYFTSEDWAWNVLDFLIVVLAMAEFIVTLAEQSQSGSSLQQISFFRMLRVARVGRGLRVLRAVRFLVPLRLLLLSIANALKALVWAVLLIDFLLFGFAFVFTQFSIDFCREQAASDFDTDVVPHCSGDTNDVRRYWESLGSSMLTLMMSIVGGIEWELPLYAITKVSPMLAATFFFYISLMVLCVLNVVTGIFCQQAIETAAEDREIAIAAQQAQSRYHVEAMEQIFKEMDENASGDITFDELSTLLLDPRMLSFFKAIDIKVEPQSMWSLFCILDSDESGSIDAEEFVSGCLNFRGYSKATQTEQVKREQKHTRELLKDVWLEVRQLRAEAQMDKVPRKPGAAENLPKVSSEVVQGANENLPIVSSDEVQGI